MALGSIPRNCRTFIFCRCAFLLAIFLCVRAGAQSTPPPASSLGLFQEQSDIGTVVHEGTGQYDAAAKAYTVTGSGEDIWAANDDFHFVWTKVSGDVTISADIALIGTEGDGHRKGVLMIRQSLDADSPYADAALHGDGLTALQYRETKGAPTHEIQSNLSAPKRLRLQKRGDRFYLSVGSDDQSMTFAGGSAKVVLTTPFYVGIGVCAHNKDAVQKVSFSNVDLNAAAPANKPATYSTIQTITVASTDSRVALVSSDRLESPSWSNDGLSILFANNGKTLQVPATGGTAQASDAELDESYGQDRSPDNRYIYMGSNRSGTMQIWRTASGGSNPEQITHDDSNNANPHLSPDGHQMLFVSYPSRLMLLPDNTDITLKVMNLADRKVKTLINLVGGRNTLGSHPWSPDGKQVAFISNQSIAP